MGAPFAWLTVRENTSHGSSTRTARMPPPWEVPQLRQLHGAEFAVGDLAQTQSFSSLGTHGSAVSRGRVRHHT